MTRRRTERAAGLITLLALLAAVSAYAIDDCQFAGAFSAERPGAGPPAGWKPLTIANVKARTRYTLVDDGGVTVLRAESQDGASGLSRPLRIDPAELPWLRWHWKISNFIETADLRSKDVDAFPARIYVMFDYPLEKTSVSGTQQTASCKSAI